MRIPTYCEVNTQNKKTNHLNLSLLKFNQLFLHHSRSHAPQPFIFDILPRTLPAPTLPPYNSPEYIPVTPPYTLTVSIYTCSSRPLWAAKMSSLSSRLSVYTLLIPSGTVRTPSHCPSSPKIYTDTPLQEIVYSTPFLTNCMETNPVIPKSVMPPLST